MNLNIILNGSKIKYKGQEQNLKIQVFFFSVGSIEGFNLLPI